MKKKKTQTTSTGYAPTVRYRDVSERKKAQGEKVRTVIREVEVIKKIPVEVLPEPKDATQSRTLWINIAGALAFIAGMIAVTVDAGMFADKETAALVMATGGLLLAIANFIRRFYTDRPIAL